MRLVRFDPWAREVLAMSPAFAAVQSFAEIGTTDPRYGALVTLAAGSKVKLQFVRASGPGGDVSEEEEISTGDPVAAVEPVEVPASGPVQLRVFEQHLVALFTNTGHQEIKSVRGFSCRPESSSSQKYGVEITFHTNAVVYVLFRAADQAGRASDPMQQQKQPETV
ncbi:hypothetical protein ACGFJT_42360 [Actinomadura geliboluensis]|uniref:hypothetical protein n=1 Tax=Actinomadura geliboluensis TaxID=882440 RepID=UPI0037224270